jgi:phosphoglucomutase
MKTIDTIRTAGAAGQLLPGAVENLTAWLEAGLPAWAAAGIEELAAQGAWGELNDRFYRYLEFGTGGMRGRTIGVVTAKSETGQPGPLGTPEHPAVGSNMMNDFTVVRATIGLYRYVHGFLSRAARYDAPKLVIAHDVRHFSRHFCELAASTWSRLGGVAFVFEAPRSTPQLSFSVRWLKAHCGVVITASHNPPHDNGFKAYFEDGGQVVTPHDNGIIDEVNAVPLAELGAFLTKDLSRVITLGRPADDAYLAVALQAALDPAVFKRQRFMVVYTNIHGTGGVATIPLLAHAGVSVREVPEQVAFDPRFPTVKSPNPENAEALTLAVALAEKSGADLVLATDPDADRMAAAVRSRDGKMVLVTGNQIGALLADYRLARNKELGRIPAGGSRRAALIKTFVTTPLQDAIGEAHGVKVINTLTGFKWIGAKLRVYEDQLKSALLAQEGLAVDYDGLSLATRARLQGQYGTFYVFGTEESYGFLPNDFVRDKDGNAACLMFAELCAWVKSRGLTVPEYLDELYVRHGYFIEGVINIYYQGATGAAKIRRILDSYRSDPPKAFGDVAVAKVEDFGRETIRDADGEEIPKQDLYVVTLANGYSFAGRGSGTEPKMKFYVFARSKVAGPADLPAVKVQANAELERLKALIESDAKARAEG